MLNARLSTAPAIIAALWLVAGCTTTAPVTGEFPDPVLTPLNMTVGVRYTEEFSNYVYEESAPGEKSWVVQMGSANVGLFESVFGSMFAGTVQIDGSESPRALGRRVDLVIQPEVESYEFAIPTDWGTKSFSVWITYRINVLTPEGDLVVSWPVRAYGQSRHKLFNADDSLADATTMAMRDAGAYTTIYFEDEPRIREWLREQSAAARSPRRRSRAPVKIR
ncbi:MAG: hypothetical protein OEU49_09440 [Chromatiales bacterium]|jgi:hypothetical protein|nr:hypothetical protein [Chromatiales bacterium]